MMKTNPTTGCFDVAVVGAGPAGMLAALAAARAGAKVVLLEQLDRAGAKLCVTGGGRCNITTTLPVDEILASFGRQGRFAAPALEALSPEALCELLAEFGEPTVCDGASVYPRSQSAVAVRNALWAACGRAGVDCRTRARVDSLDVRDGKLAGLVVNGSRLPARRVVLATGGCSYPELGAAGIGYELARQAGHRIVEPSPGLAPLVLRESWLTALSGVSLPESRVWIDIPRQPNGQIGPVLFTHRGLSGPAVLNMSSAVGQLLGKHKTVPIRLRPIAAIDGKEWAARLSDWREQHGRRSLMSLLSESMPHSFVCALMNQCGLAETARPSHIKAEQSKSLVEMLGGMPLTVTSTEGFAHAMVTLGGVHLGDVFPKTLGSKIMAGLFFAGELLDLAGPCGGFNLTWAFASGYLAGQSAAAK